MYRYNYPVWHELMRVLRRFSGLVLGLLLFFVTVELVRAYQLFYGFHPWLGYGFALLAGGAGASALLRLRLRRHDRQTLLPPHPPSEFKPHHEELVANCSYMIHRLKRLSLNPALSDELRKKTRQRAYDIEGLLGSHPLLEDMVRALSRAELDTLEPTLLQLDHLAREMGKEKIQCMIEDAVEPPFPLVTPLVVLYHQCTLVTTIADVYLGRPSLREYLRVLTDVQHTIRGGEFFRIGQRLFEGVYVNSPPLGRAVDDLGQAITCAWLTESVTKAAQYRCRAIRPWKIGQAVDWMDRQTESSLVAVRDLVNEDVLPLLKLRLRHYAGPGVGDASNFSEQMTQSIARAVDAVVKGLQTQNPVRAAQLSRRTQPGEGVLNKSEQERATPTTNRSWRRRGVFGIVRTFGERMRYTKTTTNVH